MKKAHIAIVSLAGELHALAIREALRAYPDVVCDVVESDRICGGPHLSWSCATSESEPSSLPSSDGTPLDVSALDLIWWRRFEFPQQTPSYLTEPAHLDVVNNDCNAALQGLLLTEFRGVWINEPTATRLAENKLVQLRAARQAGFRIPETLVSQDPARIRAFCTRHRNRVVIKPVRGTHLAYLFTRMVTEAVLASDESLQLSPAIYQECIPGARHLRVQCFGDDIYAAMIESEELDWRGDLDIPFTAVELDGEVKRQLREVLDLLGLRMGIVDLKLTDGGQPVWIEVNPQGQFLFVEGLTGLDLTLAFAAFLRQEALRAAALRCA